MQAYALLQAYMAIETVTNGDNSPYVPEARPRRGLGTRVAAAIGQVRRALATPVSTRATETPRLEGYPYRT